RPGGPFLDRRQNGDTEGTWSHLDLGFLTSAVSRILLPLFYLHGLSTDDFPYLAARGSFRRRADSAAQGGLPLHMRQLLRIAHGVEPGDEAVVDAYRHDGVDLSVEPENQRRVSIDLCRLQRRRGGDPA